jgi:hypothetical protein
MTKTEALLRQGRTKLDVISAKMRSSAPEFSALARRRKLLNLEARFKDVNQRFEMLRTAGTVGIADLKVGLEKAFDAFCLDIGWKP